MILMLTSFMNIFPAQAASQKMTATAREPYTDDTSVSMSESFARQAEDEKAFQEKTLAQGAETVRLLRDIKNLLRALLEKKN